MNKAVFLDRDGTINVDKHYLYKEEDFEYLPGVVEALRIFQKEGYLLFVITNQSGIARGYFTERDYERMDQWMKEDLERRQVHLTASYYCPHLPNAKVLKYRVECDCRKPGIGLFEKAAREYGIDLMESYTVGDRLRDLKICRIGCRGFLVGNSESEDVILKVRSGQYEKIGYCLNLLECANMIKMSKKCEFCCK